MSNTTMNEHDTVAHHQLTESEKRQLLERLSKRQNAPASTSNPDTTPENFYKLDLFPSYLQTKRQLDLFKQAKITLPFFKSHENIAKDTTIIGGKECISYSTYNYLDLSGDPRVSEAAKEAIDRYGTSVSASRIVSGEIPLHRELENALAKFLGTEDCLVFVSGHATNVTTIGHLFGPNDLIIHDAASHNSIVQGAILSGAKRINFQHNNIKSLEMILSSRRNQFERILIVTEALFSMDGDIAPLPEIIALKKRYHALLMVDEAHSLGVLGKTGHGAHEHFNIDPTDVDLWMGTLSKTLGACGGYIAGNHALIEGLKYGAPGFVFSVGLSPPLAAASVTSLEIIEKEPVRVQRLQSLGQLFLKLAKENGLNTITAQGYAIIPILVGRSIEAVKLSNALFEKGIHVQPIIYPAVTKEAARLRFFLSSAHTEEQIRYTMEHLINEYSKLDLDY